MNPQSTVRRWLAATTLVGLLALGAVACTSAPAAGPDLAGATGSTVTIDGMTYAPKDLTVPAGTTVTWVWDGAIGHDVVGEDFASEVQSNGKFSHTFEEPGTYDYHCTLHPNMTGTIEVTQ